MTRTYRSIHLGILALTFSAFLAGCQAPSLLITLVSSGNPLTETVLMRDSRFARDKIALIDVSGLLMNSPRRQILGQGEHPVSLFLEQLDKARSDPAVKGVILRINSPGGTVVASQLMYDEIQYFKKSGKPVVAVMMDVAASGGYYIACACDEIVAQPSTVTGSIGVIMEMFDVSNTLRKIGVETRAITSGAFKDAGSPFRIMKDEERELFQGMVNDMYERFVHVVDKGRPALDEAAVRSLADGRVFTGDQALEVGLVDRLAGMRDTVGAMKKKLGSRNIRLVTYHRPHGYKPNYYAMAPSTTEVKIFNFDLSPWLTSTTPGFMYLWQPAR